MEHSRLYSPSSRGGGGGGGGARSSYPSNGGGRGSSSSGDDWNTDWLRSDNYFRSNSNNNDRSLTVTDPDETPWGFMLGSMPSSSSSPSRTGPNLAVGAEPGTEGLNSPQHTLPLHHSHNNRRIVSGFVDSNSSSAVGWSTDNTARFRRLQRRRKRIRFALGFLLALVVVIIAVVLGVTLSNNKSNSNNKEEEEGPTTQTQTQTQQEQDGNKADEPSILITPPSKDNHNVDGTSRQPSDELFNFLASISPDGGVALATDGTPQNYAYYWLDTDSYLQSYSQSKMKQRFALATLYYATEGNPDPQTKKFVHWKNATKWLEQEHDECLWYGISCDHNSWQVNEINLEDNNLSGKLPQELLLLKDSLEKFNIHKNYVEMSVDEFAFLGELTKLTTLSLGDSYLYSNTEENQPAVPTEFAKLVNLEEFEMSYTRVEGLLPDIFASMSKLRYLQIEDSYLTGSTIPASLGNLQYLETLKMRNNNFGSNLSFLQSGKLLNLNTMYLDLNKLSGPIPTEIGLMTELVSLSLRDNFLSSTIPTQIGNLSKLAHLLLYKNNLNGEVPTEIGKLANLETFEIHENSIGGTMPDQVCDLTKNGKLGYPQSDCNAEIVCSCCMGCM